MAAKTRLSHTNEILASAGMKKLIDALRQVYDYVLIDLPPLTPVVDVRSTAQFVDSYLFVIEWGRRASRPSSARCRLRQWSMKISWVCS